MNPLVLIVLAAGGAYLLKKRGAFLPVRIDPAGALDGQAAPRPDSTYASTEGAFAAPAPAPAAAPINTTSAWGGTTAGISASTDGLVRRTTRTPEEVRAARTTTATRTTTRTPTGTAINTWLQQTTEGSKAWSDAWAAANPDQMARFAPVQ